MIVLLTGHRGRLGQAIGQRLAAAGHEVRGFDLSEGGDTRDADAVRSAARGADIIVNIAGIAGDRQAHASEVMAVNVAGTWNVLLAAESEGIHRVVHFSSGKALGLLERDPDYLPVDDDHRGLPLLPYALSKWLGEEMCAAFTERTGIDTICLRPVAVFDAHQYEHAADASEWKADRGGSWHLGVHIDVRDVAEATLAALTSSLGGHHRLLLCAEDIASRRPTLELVEKYLPHVPWLGGEAYAADPFRGLIDTRRAREVLDWQPRHRWPGRSPS
jgi:UDP-glucose 4-epimerase